LVVRPQPTKEGPDEHSLFSLETADGTAGDPPTLRTFD
jgi:hypothetical protein